MHCTHNVAVTLVEFANTCINTRIGRRDLAAM
jgi:hypothetical protein